MRRILRAAGKVLLLLICAALAALPAVCSASIYGWLPLLLLICALALSLIWLLLLRRSVRAELLSEDAACPRGGTLRLTVRVENRCSLFCPLAAAELQITDPLGAAAENRCFHFSLGGRRSAELVMELDMPHVGCCGAALHSLRIYGFFRLLSLSVPCAGALNATVLPLEQTPEALTLRGAETRDAERDTRVTAVGGTDYTGVREYALGDPMKQIHWKLSAHERNYVTKLQERARQKEFAIVLDFCAQPQPDRETLLSLNDCLIESALSLAAAVQREEGERALLYVDAEGTVRRSVQLEGSAVGTLLQSFAHIRSEAEPDFPDAAALLRQEGRGANRAANLMVVTSRVTEELLQELQTVRRQRRSPALFLVIPAAWTSREREDEANRLRTLETMEIPFYFVSTAEADRS